MFERMKNAAREPQGNAGGITHENNNEDQEYLDDFVMENYEVCGNTIDNPGLLERTVSKMEIVERRVNDGKID